MTGVPRSQVLLRATSTAANQVVSFVCPAGHVTLVKSLLVQNAGSAETEVSLLASNPDGSLIVTAWWSPTIAVNDGASWEGWFVLNAADWVAVFFMESGVRVWLSGAVLAGPAQFPPAEQVRAANDDLVAQVPSAQRGRPAY